MIVVAKSLEALGIACVMIGLVQGLNSETMWMELYLFLIGMAIFGLGWWIEKRITRKHKDILKDFAG
ncbi:MAG: hypothetical protein ACKVRP_08770 [Bacteroidota bacterium]